VRAVGDDRIDDPSWHDAAEALIPGGASTGSKRTAVLYGDDDTGPTHFVRAKGCTIETAGGRTLIDCTMALGTVAIGYADRDVTDAVVTAAREGPVSGLSSVREVQLAERLIDMIPCAEQVRFLKTGAEAGAAAIRLARVITGADTVIACGYFGWLDWSNDAAGVPAATRADLLRIPFDDLTALDAAVDEAMARPGGLAAIIVEPVIEQLASPAWFAAIRAHCDRCSAVFILDEVKTGFRLRPGGAHELLSLSPDLAVFGKAMANGYPLAAVVGRAAVMEAATRTWISSTLASEGVALAASLAVMDRHDRTDVCEQLETIGLALQQGVRQALEVAGVTDLAVVGPPQLWGLRADAPARRDRFVQGMLAHGVLCKRGFYNFPSLAHDVTHCRQVAHAAAAAAQALEALP
jgi:glutamate-1-semialdehyde 2,1-aminomutase